MAKYALINYEDRSFCNHDGIVDYVNASLKEIDYESLEGVMDDYNILMSIENDTVTSTDLYLSDILDYVVVFDAKSFLEDNGFLADNPRVLSLANRVQTDFDLPYDLEGDISDWLVDNYDGIIVASYASPPENYISITVKMKD